MLLDHQLDFIFEFFLFECLILRTSTKCATKFYKHYSLFGCYYNINFPFLLNNNSILLWTIQKKINIKVNGFIIWFYMKILAA